MNPIFIAMMWALTICMAAAIALSSAHAIITVVVLTIILTTLGTIL